MCFSNLRSNKDSLLKMCKIESLVRFVLAGLGEVVHTSGSKATIARTRQNDASCLDEKLRTRIEKSGMSCTLRVSSRAAKTSSARLTAAQIITAKYTFSAHLLPYHPSHNISHHTTHKDYYKLYAPFCTHYRSSTKKTTLSKKHSH